MTDLNVALAVTAATVMLIGLFSKPIKQGPVQEPLIAALVGIATGPHLLGWIDLGAWGNETIVLEEASRLTLAIGLMGIALRVHISSLRALWRPVFLLLTLGMLAMWAVSSALAGWLFGLSFWIALLVGAAVTPTDPVVASSIVTGSFARNHLPLRVRDTISLESGTNDGLAYMFVLLPILMTSASSAGPWSTWLLEVVVYGVVGAAAVGCLIGGALAQLVTWAKRRDIIENPSFLTQTVTLSLLTLGAAALIGMDALISVFLAGLVFNLLTDPSVEHEEEKIQEAFSKLFTLPIFVLFGAAIPWSDWAELGWPLFTLALLVLLLRRLPLISALLIWLRPALNKRDVLYVAWFGPVGVAAIYYATFAERIMDMPLVWTAASAVIFASLLGHGVTAAPFTRLYARGQQHDGQEEKRLKSQKKGVR